MIRGRDIVEIEEIHHNIWMIDEGAGLIYLVRGREKCAVIDTGFGFCDLPALVRGIAGNMPVVVINTHAHADHIYGNSMFEQAYMGYLDEPFALCGFPEVEFNTMIEYERRADFFAKAGITPENWKPGCCEKIIPLFAGDHIDLGDITLEVFEVPGHTMGSVALLERQSGILFTGDTLFTGEIWMHLQESTRLSAFRRSLIRLRKDLNGAAKAIAPGHKKNGCPNLLPINLADSVIEGISEILDEKIIGIPVTTLRGAGFEADFDGNGGVIYNPARL